MSTFDPMAAAIDWLDAYRAASLSIVDLYAELASLECACGGRRIMVGHDAITLLSATEYRTGWSKHSCASMMWGKSNVVVVVRLAATPLKRFRPALIPGLEIDLNRFSGLWPRRR